MLKVILAQYKFEALALLLHVLVLIGNVFQLQLMVTAFIISLLKFGEEVF